jgi:hypothetical protein
MAKSGECAQSRMTDRENRESPMPGRAIRSLPVRSVFMR